MSKTIYCFRCKADVPVLDEQEWKQVEPLLDAYAQIKALMAEGMSLAEARRNWGATARARYEELTGYREVYADNIFHHRLSAFGPPCGTCGKPLRTPRAKLCAECGTPRASE